MRTSLQPLPLLLLVGSASAQICQTTTLPASDPQAGALVGSAVALSADTLIGGAYNADALVNGPGFRGAVYVWRENNGQWTFEAKIDGPASPSSLLGRAVAIDGDVLVASGFSSSAPYERALVFRRTAGVWNPETTLIPNDPVTASAVQPRALAIEGNRIAVGHPVAGGQPVVSASRTGAVYIYELSGTWQQTAKLVPTNAAMGDQVGMALAMRGGVLAFSQRPSSAATGPAAVHIYSFPTNAPLLDGTFSPTNAGASTFFGVSVATDGQRVAVGDLGDTGLAGNQGAVHVYARNNGVWVEEQLLYAATPTGSGAQFGVNVAIDGDQLLVNGFGASGNQRVWRFERVNGTWVQQYEPAEVVGAPQGIVVSGDMAALGHTGSTVNSLTTAGTVDVYRVGCQAASYGAGLAGTGGRVPTLLATACPFIGSPFALQIGNGRGGAVAVLAYSFAPANLPLLGGTQLISFPLTTQLMTLAGNPGSAGAGSATQPLPLANPSLVGLAFYAQAGVIDPAAAQSVALTRALQVLIN